MILATAVDYEGVWSGTAPSSVYRYELDVSFHEGEALAYEYFEDLQSGLVRTFTGTGPYTVDESGVLLDFTVWAEGSFHTYSVIWGLPDDFSLLGAFAVSYSMVKISGS